MKKRIVALVSALTLVFAMSMNVAAAESVTADDAKEIAAVAGEVTSFPASQDALNKSADAAEELLVTKDVTVAPLTNADSVKELAKEAAALKTDKVEEVKVVAVFDISGKAGKVVFKINLKDGQEATALHLVGGKNVPIKGVKVDGGVEFDFTSFSPVAIVVTTEKAAAPAATNQPPYNPAWDPNVTNASAPAAAPVAAPVAPKTGDVVMMVSIMAIIFMAGAAVAVAMSKKRA